MKSNYNSIKSMEYNSIKTLLGMVIKKKFPTNEKIMGIKNIPLFICALFVAIKEKKYRESSFLLLNKLINIYTFEFMYNILKNSKTKSYQITSLDIPLKTRREIINYMFLKLPNPNFYSAIIFSLGFYLTPEVVDLLEEYQNSDNRIIQREATYGIDFIKRKTKNS